MPAERAGYTVTMFLVDTSPSMANTRTVELPPGPNGEERTKEMTNLEWALQFVKLKIQDMIFNGRKTDQCGVILFGSEETKNMINEKNGGYDHVSEYILIGQPNAGTLSKLDLLEASESCGDPIDALIVGIETQATYLASKKTWTRKIVIVTDGESPIEVEDWEATVEKMNGLDISLTLIGVDFDDEDFGYTQPDKSHIKKENESFYRLFTSSLNEGFGVVGTCVEALQEISKPDIKTTKSTLMGTILRLGETDTMAEEAVEIIVKTSKSTALARPKSWKKFGMREGGGDGEEDEETQRRREEGKVAYAQLKMRTEYYIDRSGYADAEVDEDGDVKMEDDDDLLDLDKGKKVKVKSEDDDDLDVASKAVEEKEAQLEKVEKEQLVRGFKYGTTYAPCPDGQFPRLPTRKGIELCGFFPAKNFRRELSLGEIQYVWADPASASQQVAMSSIVQAMYEKNVMAIARWVTKDGMDPKMGVLTPVVEDAVDCFLWAQMPFADDVRKYSFASLDHLVTKKGEVLTEHPFIPTEDQCDAMDNFIDAMDLMDAGEKDEEGIRGPWFDTLLSYNPAIHRTKQAMFHCAIVSDIDTNPLPPPHPELLKYFDPPRRVLKRARDAIEECKSVFKVKQVPKKVARTRKDGHVHAKDEDEDLLLLERKRPSTSRAAASQSQTPVQANISLEASPKAASKAKAKANADDSETEEEDEEEEMLLDSVKKPVTPHPEQRNNNNPLPTPARSMSPESQGIDRGIAPGRIIGSTFPLRDFRKNLAQGDVVTKAVEDIGSVVTEIVLRPFASKRNKELFECLEVLRETCLTEDEIDAWNAFLTDLKYKCTSTPGNPQFWDKVKNYGRTLSLISDEEAKKHGGASDITEREAEKRHKLLPHPFFMAASTQQQFSDQVLLHELGYPKLSIMERFASRTVPNYHYKIDSDAKLNLRMLDLIAARLSTGRPDDAVAATFDKRQGLSLILAKNTPQVVMRPRTPFSRL
ncbi:hypothetical protein DXG03_001976 [Asterophora parasitica]|uniref:ATP-dependent DNA helicase II subunit 2 n=1 Tax=Asterophora parasitica TaxID=117018 RepID=A0A9P7GGH1_9AGAR|nr:hypothetical protein DXG03_001976 [Asterophora parasitica]